MERPGRTLDALPHLSNSWRGGLCSDERVGPGLQVLELALHERALGEAGAEEGRVDEEQDPGALGEEDGGEEDSAPEKDFQESDQTHGGLVGFLDELANGVGSGVGLGLAAWGDSTWWRRLESRDQVCAGIGRDVED